MSTRNEDLEAVLFEFTGACELPPWPGKEWPRFCPTRELLDEWTAKHPEFRRELVDYATDMVLLDIADEHATVPTEEEVNACVEKSMAVIRPMIDAAFAARKAKE